MSMCFILSVNDIHMSLFGPIYFSSNMTYCDMKNVQINAFSFTYEIVFGLVILSICLRIYYLDIIFCVFSAQDGFNQSIYLRIYAYLIQCNASVM